LRSWQLSGFFDRHKECSSRGNDPFEVWHEAVLAVMRAPNFRHQRLPLAKLAGLDVAALCLLKIREAAL
jgi:hypothetical protein